VAHRKRRAWEVRVNRLTLALAATGVVLLVSGCSFGQVTSIDAGAIGGVVHGQATSDQDWSSGAVFVAAVAAPAPKIPRQRDFDPLTDTATFDCATLTATDDPLTKDVTIPIGIDAAVTPACGLVGVERLQINTEYNVRLCAADGTHTTGFSCGGVRSFTTQDP